jgi:hypothetical protein
LLITAGLFAFVALLVRRYIPLGPTTAMTIDDTVTRLDDLGALESVDT